MDEAGIYNTGDYAYGWCHKSERFFDLKLGHKTERISMIAGWSSTVVIAPLTFKGYCNKNLVETWVEECLIPEFYRDQIIIIDLASFHKSSKIKELIEKARCQT